MISAAFKPVPLPWLRVCGLGMQYACRRGMFRRATTVSVLEDVSLTLARGATMAIVGESGAGKSTLARCIAGLEQPDSGQIWLGSLRIATDGAGRRREIAHQVQLVMQDSATALNPRFTAAEIIAEPLVIHGRDHVEVASRVMQLLEAVGLARRLTVRRPHQLSGGQRQRLALARALALQPALLILDEAFSGLDLAIQEHILNLLAELQERFALTYLLISHDLRLAAAIAEFIAVMSRGRIVEQGATRNILSNPQHAHTRALIQAVPGRGLAVRGA